MGSAPVSKTGGNNISSSIVWLDASSRSAHEYINTERLLRTPRNYLKTYKDDRECERYIQSVPKQHQIILIVDGKYGQVIVPRIHQLIQVSAIFVRSMDKKNEQWTKKYKKVKGVFEEIDELITTVLLLQEKQSSRHDRFEEPLLINIYNTDVDQDQSESESNDQFVRSQKLIYNLLRIKPVLTERNEFITYCKKEYANNTQQLFIIREFQQNYSADSALKWYTRDCFLYKLLNKALRMQNIDLLNLFGFFIRDLHRQLKQSQYSKRIHVYKSQLMTEYEVQDLKNSIGQLISINSFVSTTPDREIAISFLSDIETSKSDLNPVLFDIDADPRIPGIKPFADITSGSNMANEKEILIMLGSIFRLIHIHYDDTLCVIQLVLCSDNSHHLKPIFDQIKIHHHPQGNTNAGVIVNAPAPMEKIDETDSQIQRELHQTPSEHSSNMTNSRMSNSKRVSIYKPSVQHKKLVNALTSKETVSLRINGLPKPPATRRLTLVTDDPGITEIHHDDGHGHYASGEYKQALQSYNKALTINRHAFDEDHFQVAQSYSSVASIHAKQGKYLDALNYMQKALDIRTRRLPANHHMLGLTHTNMGDIYLHLRKYNLALEHYNIALRIYEKSLPPQHHNFGVIYNGIGTVHLKKHQYQPALTYYERAAAVFRQTVPPDHPDAINVQRNIDEARRLK